MPRVSSTYTTQMGLHDLDIFKKECEEFYNQEVIQRVPQVMKFTAAVVIHHLLKRSPVLTGAYMLRHRLTKQDIVTADNTKMLTADELRKAFETWDKGVNQPRRSANYQKIRRKARQNLFRKLRNTSVRFGGRGLRLTNSIRYAYKVEYGWPSGARGYRVYGQAHENTRLTLARILQSISYTKWKQRADSKRIDDKLRRELIQLAIKADEVGDVVAARQQLARDQGYKVFPD